jgi:hypothetical protein
MYSSRMFTRFPASRFTCPRISVGDVKNVREAIIWSFTHSRAPSSADT